MRFEVWAPAATRVGLVLGQDRITMTAGEGGWWHVDTDAPPGADYTFSLDGGEPRPDPRSPWQPQGVHGPSRLVDHESFNWSDSHWSTPALRETIVYELHVGTFTPEGTFEAITQKLDHLIALGVTAIELMPVNQFPGERGWGYDGVDLYAAHEAYGGPEALKRLVDECHRRGLAVIADVVYNHLGPSGNYLREYGPYFTDRYSTPWGDAVNFDGSGSDEVRAFFIDNAVMWLRDYHFDGLRIDAIHAILDTSATHFLEQLADATAGLVPPRYRIAESDLNDPRVVYDSRRGGFGLDAQWSDDFHHALHAALTGERDGYYEDFGALSDIATALRQAFVYAGRHSKHRGRTHGRLPQGVEGHRFLGFLQNHDQVGNRALGERTSHLLSTGLLKVGAALALTSPFVPMLFQGEEWGASTPFLYFTDHDDPELGRAVSDGRRSEFAAFGWDPEEIPDPQDPTTFMRSKLNWAEVDEEPHAGLLEWHRRLISLRKEVPALTDGDLGAVRVAFDEDDRRLVLERGPVTVACNLAPEPKRVPVDAGRTGDLLLYSADEPKADPGEIELPGESVAIFVAG